MTVVVKIGTSITAEDDGRLRLDGLGRICDGMGTPRDGVKVSSGGIAR